MKSEKSLSDTVGPPEPEWHRLLWPDGRMLTMREREVLTLHARGQTSNQIAKALGISATTVKFHTQNAVYKLGASNKTAAVARAVMLGLLVESRQAHPAQDATGAASL